MQGTRRQMLTSGALAALLGAAMPNVLRAADHGPSTAARGASSVGGGLVVTVPSTSETVRLGVFDSTLPAIVEVESGDTVVYPDTWTHYLNRLQPGVPIEVLDELARANPMIGPHSIIGPVGVRGAEPGDIVEIRFLRLLPLDFGAAFNNSGDLGEGTLPQEFPRGQVRYFSLDTRTMTTEFLPGITLPLAPFQGTFGVAPPQGGVISSTRPGQYAGNIDLSNLTEGSSLFIPVWQPGAKLYTGDSHALQGDGEVTDTGIETGMRELRIQVLLHKQVGWRWPFAEDDQYWFAIGADPDLSGAFTVALRNTLDFLERRAGLSRLDAYALASVIVSFRISQVVNKVVTVHAVIPKAIFSPARRASISIV